MLPETGGSIYGAVVTGLVVEHRASLFSRRLRRRRVEIALGIAAVEAVLVLVGIVPWWAVIAAAAVSLAAYAGAGRRQPSPGLRTATWLAAVSQLVVVLVPVAIALVGLLALAVLVVFAGVALTVILHDRR